MKRRGPDVGWMEGMRWLALPMHAALDAGREFLERKEDAPEALGVAAEGRGERLVEADVEVIGGGPKRISTSAPVAARRAKAAFDAELQRREIPAFAART